MQIYSDFFFQLLSQEKKSCLKDVLKVKLVASYLEKQNLTGPLSARAGKKGVVKIRRWPMGPLQQFGISHWSERRGPE